MVLLYLPMARQLIIIIMARRTRWRIGFVTMRPVFCIACESFLFAVLSSLWILTHLTMPVRTIPALETMNESDSLCYSFSLPVATQWGHSSQYLQLVPTPVFSIIVRKHCVVLLCHWCHKMEAKMSHVAGGNSKRNFPGAKRTHECTATNTKGTKITKTNQIAIGSEEMTRRRSKKARKRWWRRAHAKNAFRMNYDCHRVVHHNCVRRCRTV